MDLRVGLFQQAFLGDDTSHCPLSKGAGTHLAHVSCPSTHQLVLGRLQYDRWYVRTKLCTFPCSSVCTQLLVSRPDEENITSYLQLIEKCLTHEVGPLLGLPRGSPPQSSRCTGAQVPSHPFQRCLQMLSFCTHPVGSGHLLLAHPCS